VLASINPVTAGWSSKTPELSSVMEELCQSPAEHNNDSVVKSILPSKAATLDGYICCSTRALHL